MKCPLAHAPYDVSQGKNVQYKKIGFVYNPKAFKGQGESVFTKQVEPYIKELLGDRTVLIAPTKKAGGALENTQNLIQQGCDLIVACGGDGTVHETLNGIMDPITKQAKAALAVIPIGTGNDFAKSCGMQQLVKNKWVNDYRHVIQVIKDGHTIASDIGHVQDANKQERFWMNSCGIGLSGEVMNAVNSTSNFWVSKEFTFQFQTLWQQLVYANKTVDATFDGKQSTFVCQAIIFSNGQFYGAGMHGAPKASLNDGILHYGILGNVKLFDMVKIVPLLYKGEHDKHPKVTVGSCQQFTCQLLPDQKSTHKLRIEADGEVCGIAPCTVSVVPKVLPLVVAQFS